MAFFWITGLPGSGKTTVLEALKALGFVALDADDDGMCEWRERATGKRVDNISSTDNTPEWLEAVEWRIKPDRVDSIAKQAENHHVFLGGSVANDAEVWELFDRHVFLTVMYLPHVLMWSGKTPSGSPRSLR